MIPVKTSALSQASTANAAGATQVGVAVDLRGFRNSSLWAKVTNGATGPGAGAVFLAQVSHDNIVWFDAFTATAGVTALTAYSFSYVIPEGVAFARSSFSGNTLQPVTVESRTMMNSRIDL